MPVQELKLKQASAALGVPPKDLQNLVQLGVIQPRRRDNLFWFDFNLLLQAKVAFYLRESLGTSSELLAQFCAALSREFTSPGRRFQDISIHSRPPRSREALEVKIPLRSLAEELQEQIPRAYGYKDLPRGRKRPGWKKELVRTLKQASGALKNVTEDEITDTIRKYRSERKKLPEIAIVARTKEKTA